jgi:hypothetical protein
VVESLIVIPRLMVVNTRATMALPQTTPVHKQLKNNVSSENTLT